MLDAVQLMNPMEVNDLTIQIRAANANPGLIVIDTVARTFVGGDENSAQDAGRWIEGMQKLARNFQAAILAIHHTAKPRGNKLPAIRGSSAFHGAADAMIRVNKTGQKIRISCDKMKDAEEFAAFNVRLEVAQIGEESGVPITSCVITQAGDDALFAQEPRALTENAKTLLLTFLEAGGSSIKKDWEERTRLPERDLFRAIKLLTERELTQKIAKGIYKLTEEGTATAKQLQSQCLQ